MVASALASGRGPRCRPSPRTTSWWGTVSLLEAGRRLSARAVNAAMTAAYWGVGQRIVEQELRAHAAALPDDRECPHAHAAFVDRHHGTGDEVALAHAHDPLD